MLYMKKGFSTDDDNNVYHKVRDHCHYTGNYRGAAHDICSLRYKTPKENPIAFHNSSTNDYHFIIKEGWGLILMLRRKCREIYYLFSIS